MESYKSEIKDLGKANKNTYLSKFVISLDNGVKVIKEKNIKKKALTLFWLFILIIFVFSSFTFLLNYDYSSSRGWITDTLSDIAIGIIQAFFSLLFMIVEPLAYFVINLTQELILKVFSFSWAWSSLAKLDWWWFLTISFIVFVLLTFFYLFLRSWNSATRDKETNKSIPVSAITALLLFLFGPLLMGFLFVSSGLIMDHILGYSEPINIYDLITSFTLDFVDGASSVAEKIALEFAYIFACLSVIYWLSKFALGLILRIFELIVYGLLAIPLVASSSVMDNKERYDLWQSVMIQKIMNPFLSLLGYLIALIILPTIVDALLNGNFDTIYLEEDYFKIGLAAIMPVAVFVILVSLMPEWSFTLSNKTKHSLATQMNMISGQFGSAIRVITTPMKQFKMAQATAKTLTKPLSKTTNSLKKDGKKMEKDYRTKVSGKEGEKRKEAEEKFVNKWQKWHDKQNSAEQGNEALNKAARKRKNDGE